MDKYRRCGNSRDLQPGMDECADVSHSIVNVNVARRFIGGFVAGVCFEKAGAEA